MTHANASDQTRLTLIDRVCRLDPDSWNEFYLLYEPLLLGFVRRTSQLRQLGLNDQDVEDVKQEVMLKLYKVLPDFRPDRSAAPQRKRFRDWLWTVTHNAAIDLVRQRRRRLRVPGRANDSGGHGAEKESALPLVVHKADVGDPVDTTAEEPPAQLIREHDEYVLQVILEQVRAETQATRKWDCFFQTHHEGRPSAAVARELGITVSLVNTNTWRVRRRIRELCQDKGIDLV
jgi:RNA polymerase sigma-70 factor (ECF subfamily)